MTGLHLNRLIKAAPFRPFTIIPADGSTVAVPHPEVLNVSKTGRIIEIERLDESFIIVDLLLVLALDVSPPPSPVGDPMLDQPGSRP